MFENIINKFTETLFVIASILLGLIVIIFCIEIFMRYFLSAPTSWAPDTVTFLFCGSLMLSLPKVTKDHGHIAVTIILDYSSETIVNSINKLLTIISLLVLSYVSYISCIELFRLIDTGINTLGSFRVPKWIVFSMIPLGFTLSALQLLILARKQILNIK
jgi:TRAP-type C4-dicarboxylate transport system permease small subunit